MEPSLTALGERLARLQDDQLKASLDLARARTRLLASSRPGPARARLMWAAAIVALVGALALVVLPKEQTLEFHVGVPGTRDRAGEWIAAPPGQSVPISFSDGTELRLMEAARARVVDVDGAGAAIIVERGELHAAVVHRPGARWRVLVGPYLVRVTGTRFEVAWEPEAEHFSLTLSQGSVVVSGPALGGERAVSAGEELSVGRREGELVVAQGRPSAAGVASTREAARPTENESEARPAVPERAEATPERSRVGLGHAPPRAPDFHELAQAGKYREALSAVEQLGFDRLCQAASSRDLMLLGDIARLAGDSDRARHAYQRVGERFSGADAGQAAFFLGRLAFDQDTDYTAAARYFERSIAESPDGPLAREAAGRLIEARVLSGDVAGGREASQRYLSRYPDGPHAKTARRLLERRAAP